jgi:hypothetical protein
MEHLTKTHQIIPTTTTENMKYIQQNKIFGVHSVVDQNQTSDRRVNCVCHDWHDNKPPPPQTKIVCDRATDYRHDQMSLEY